MLRYFSRSLQKPKTLFARKLRSQLTSGEKALWKKLRGKRFCDFKFRRQVPIGPYIVDFLCVQKRLVIEIDGDSHFEPAAIKRDKEREKYLRSHNFEILRFSNHQALREPEVVLEVIARMLGRGTD